MPSSLDFKTGLTRYWWVPLVTGIICIAFGVWCFVSPVAAISVMAYTFAALMVFDGMLDVSYAFANTRTSPNWGWSLALGIIEIVVGCWLFALPAAVIDVAFIFAIGIWIIVVAINSLCEACFMSRYFKGGVVWMILALIATIVLASIFLFNPILGGIAVWLWIGLSLLTFGIYRIILACKLRAFSKESVEGF